MNTELNEDIARKVLETVDAGLVSGLGKPEPGRMCVEAAVCFAYGLPHSDNPPCVGSAVRQFKIRLNDARWSSNEARTKGMRALAIAQLGSDSIDQVAFSKIIIERAIRVIVPIALRAAAEHAKEPHKTNLEAAARRCELEGTREAALAGKKAAAAAYAADADAAAAVAAADAAAYAADADADAAAYAYAADADAAAYAADAAAAAAADAAYAAYAADAYADAYADAAYADAYADAYAARDKVLVACAEIGLQALKILKSPGCDYLYLLDGP